ncbi:cobyric acid synthase [Thalassomonas viridans]|uniref:Cobyric acid synthase n=1 Tax=Thalassomonas viridans TaxID=137584 RepID=A0AAE9Z6Q7_9GAMM|nr:cobyric acid synthase [Thalassomonas viridans]WDE07252.1 cobyric acid synthase [Thalassomonas viridans]
MTRTLMIQGTTSDAGKSTLVTGLCRLFARRKIKVAPFKPQNMALNSAVTPCGGEIGRAQAVQAKAAFLPPEVDFNPVLLKPNSDTGAQVIIQGKAIADMEAVRYHDYKKVAARAVFQSHRNLTAKYQRVIVEGAGSPAEINLREGDIANMGFAEEVDCPVILIADIDKGGVFAHLVGTLMLLSPSEQNRVAGFVINRFRGDIALLESGLEWLEQKTGKPVLGVLPYIHQLAIAAEDAISNHQELAVGNGGAQCPAVKIKVLALVYPRTSNHTDFDALRLNPEIDFQYVYGEEKDPAEGQCIKALPPCDLLLLPGSKNVRADLAFLRAQGWDLGIQRHLRYGGKVFGICGGYQMLGELIADPLGIEGLPGQSPGLGYLAMSTELMPDKRLTNVDGILTLDGQSVNACGYEIHAGRSTFSGPRQAVLTLNGQPDGAVNDDNNVAGSYLHGIFDRAEALQLVMAWAGGQLAGAGDISETEEKAIDKLADVCEQYLAMDKIEQLFSPGA